MIKICKYLTLIALFLFVPFELPAEECPEIQSYILSGDFSAAEQNLQNKKSSKMCAVRLGVAYLERGHHDKAKKWFAYARKYANQRFNLGLYRDVLYYNLLTTSTGIQEKTIQDYFDLKMIDPDKAMSLRDVLRKGLSENALTDLTSQLNHYKPSKWFVESNSTWEKELELKEKWLGYYKVKKLIQLYHKEIKRPLDEKRMHDAINLLQTINLTVIAIEGTKKKISTESQIKELQAYQHFFNKLSQIEGTDNFEKKAKLISKASNYIENKGFKKKYRFRGKYRELIEYEMRLDSSLQVKMEMDEYFRNKNDAVPEIELVKKWQKGCDEVKLPDTYQTTINLLIDYYKIINEKRIKVHEFHCNDPFPEFVNNKEWNTNYIGREVLDKSLRQYIKDELKKKPEKMLSDIELVLLNKITQHYNFKGKDNDQDPLKNAEHWANCVATIYAGYADQDKLMAVQNNIKNLQVFYENRNNKPDVANIALDKLPDEIKTARKLIEILDCNACISKIENLLKDNISGLTKLDRLRKAANIPSDRKQWNKCKHNNVDFLNLLMKNRIDYFNEAMKTSFSCLKANDFNEGKSILNEVIESKVYYFPKNKYEGTYEYANAKYQLFEGLINKKGYQQLEPYFDDKIKPTKMNFSFFKGEEGIVTRILVSSITWKEEIQSHLDRNDYENIKIAWKKTIGATQLSSGISIFEDRNIVIPTDIEPFKTKCKDKLFNIAKQNLEAKKYHEAHKCFVFYIKTMDITFLQKNRAEALLRLAEYLNSDFEASDPDRQKLKGIIAKIDSKDKEELKSIIPDPNITVWKKRREEAEAFLVNLKYQDAVNYFEKYSVQAQNAGDAKWSERTEFAKKLLTLEKEAKGFGNKGGNRTINVYLEKAFEAGELSNPSYLQDSKDFLKKLTKDEIKQYHINHMLYIYWTAFGDLRYTQMDKKNAFGNYKKAQEYANTDEEKSNIRKRIKITKRPLFTKKKTLFQSINNLSTSAKTGKLTKEDIDQIINRIRKVGDSKKIGKERNDFTNKICAEIIQVSQILILTDEALAGRLCMKLINSSFFETSEKDLPNKQELKDFIDRQL